MISNTYNVINLNDKKPSYNFSVYHKNSFRTNKFHKKVKHCYEGTYLNGNVGFHFGFSNDNYTRSFFSYWRDWNPNFYQFSGEHVRDEMDLKINKGESLLVCFDSIKSIFLMVHGDIIIEKKMTELKNYETWYPFIDAGSSIPYSNPSVVSVNFGYSQFINNVPDGYIPWIYTYICDVCSHFYKRRVYYSLSQLVVFIIS